MIAIVQRQIRFKDGSIWEGGKEVNVTVDKRTPHIALLTPDNDEELPKRIHSKNLYMWFDEFIEITEDLLQQATFDGICPSLLGDDVEPDGWDSEGFPSALMAYGII